MDRLQSAYDKAVKERDDLNGRMNRSNHEIFGSKSLKQSSRSKVVKNDRQKEYDGGPQKMTMTITPLPLLHLKKRRQQKDVTKILSLIYKKANRMLANPSRYHYSDMMRKALVYVTSNWEDLIKYRNDGHFYNRQYARRTTSIYGEKEELIVFQ